MGKIFLGNLSMRKILVMTSSTSVRPYVRCRGGGGEAGRQESLWARECSSNFPRWEISLAALHLATRVFLAGNHLLLTSKTSSGIKNRKEHERRGDESLERSRRGRR